MLIIYKNDNFKIIFLNNFSSNKLFYIKDIRIIIYNYIKVLYKWIYGILIKYILSIFWIYLKVNIIDFNVIIACFFWFLLNLIYIK